MDPAIKARFAPPILEEALVRYDIRPDAIRLLDGFESFIYEFDRLGESYILRLGHSGRRSAALIQGEVDWINYLARGDASVARAVDSAQGNLVEEIDDGHGERFLATAFRKARGCPQRGADWPSQLYTTYGRLIGRMHALARDYAPGDPAWRRPAWNDDSLQTALRELAPDEQTAAAAYRAAYDHVAQLPTGSDAYGLIHFDAHSGNFFVDEAGQITLFDFDDCSYNWFICDIAIVLFYMLTMGEEPVALTRRFMPHFLTGYRQETTLDPAWLAEIPYFLKMREIDLYAAILHAMGPAAYNIPWCARFLSGRKARIDAGVPYVEYDFTEFASLLV
jgi:Ser/Thr protein kinase RdoA (MazF antagonist)